MILLSLGLLAFAVTDLVRWRPVEIGLLRSIGAALAGACATAGVAALADAAPWPSLAVGAVAVVILLFWVSLDHLNGRPILGIALISCVLLILFALSGSADPIGGSLAKWYEGLGFPFAEQVSVDQFTLGLAAALFLLATTN